MISMRFKELWRQVNDPLYSNSLFLAASRFLTVSAGFLFWVVAAQLYSVADVGVAAALISALGLVILLSRLGLDFSMIRFLPIRDKKKVFNTILSVTTIATVVVSAGCILIMGSISPGLSYILTASYAAVFLVFAIMNSMVAITGNAFMAMRRGGRYLCQNALLVSRIPLLVPLAFLGSFGIFSSIGIAYLIAAVFAFAVIGKSIGINGKLDKPFIRESLSFSSGNYMSNILSNAPVLLMPLLILGLSGEEEAAKYYIAFAVGHLVMIIPDAFSTSLFVEGSHGENLRKTVRKTTIAIYSLLIPAVILIHFFGTSLLGLIGEDYTGASGLLTVLAASSIPYAVSSLFVSVQNIRMRVKSVVKLNLVRSPLLLGLSYILVLEFGIIGVGYAWMITYGVLTAMVAAVARREAWI